MRPINFPAKFFNLKERSLDQLKDLLIVVYMVCIMLALFIAMLEIKIFFNLDVVPGLDIPIDEWYAHMMH